jgi:DNA-binding CsgD family transcriptional regulator
VALAHGDTATSEKYLSLWADLNETLDVRALDAAPRAEAQDDSRSQTGLIPDGVESQSSESDPGTTDEWSALSHREQAVARLVVQGLTNQQIAKRIRCSPETVKFHLRNIFRKLDIGSRVEIAKFVLASGPPK